MNHLKRMAASLTLTFVLAISVFAGEQNNPPSCNPGETNSPPCNGLTWSDESPTLGDINTPPNSETVYFFDLVEAALWTLTVF